MSICKGFRLLRKMLPLASLSVTGNCLNTLPPLKANRMSDSSVIKVYRGSCTEKVGCFFKEKKKISSVGSFTIIMDFPIRVMFTAFLLSQAF